MFLKKLRSRLAGSDTSGVGDGVGVGKSACAPTLVVDEKEIARIAMPKWQIKLRLLRILLPLLLMLELALSTDYQNYKRAWLDGALRPAIGSCGRSFDVFSGG